MEQWSNWKAMLSTQFMRQLGDTTIEGLLGEMFPMWSVPSLYIEGQLQLRESLEAAVRRVGGWCKMAASLRGCEPRSRGMSTGEDTAD
jgi:hypothetical protein